MKNILITVILILLSCKAITQTLVHIKVELENFNTTEKVLLGVDGVWRNTLVNSSGKGNFSIDVNIQQLPSFLSFETISKNGKINPQLPRLWFGHDTVSIKINWLNKSVESTDLLAFQGIAEKIEKANQKERSNYILQYPHEMPALYYAERYKTEMAPTDLEIFLTKVPAEFKNLNNAKRIENYIIAKKLGDLKIGDTVKDFSLPDKDGNRISILKSNDKTKLLTFFASNCQYSFESIGLVKELNQQNNGKIEIITLWADFTKSTWLDYKKEQKDVISWTNLWDEFGFADEYLGLDTTPSFYVIDKHGILIDKFHISRNSDKKLKRLIE